MATANTMKVTVRVVQNRRTQSLQVRGAGRFGHSVLLGTVDLRAANQPLTSATDAKTLVHLLLTQADALVLSS